MILKPLIILEPFMPAYKVGSGEIDWLEALERMAAKGQTGFTWQPVLQPLVKFRGSSYHYENQPAIGADAV